MSPEIDIYEAVGHDPMDPRPLHEQNPEGVARYLHERKREPCGWCGYHDCDLDCYPPEGDE